MNEQWYYTSAGKQSGPVSGPELKRMASSGHLSPDDMVWKEGMPNWVPAAKLKGLFTATPAATATPLPQPPAPASCPAHSQEAGMSTPPEPMPNLTNNANPMTQVPDPNSTLPTPAKGDMSWAAIVSLICGIVSIIPGCCCGCFGAPLAIVAIVFGILGRKTRQGLLAKIGLGLGAAWIVFIIVYVILVFVFGVAVPSVSDGLGK